MATDEPKLRESRQRIAGVSSGRGSTGGEFMDITSKFLSVSGGILICSLLGACASGSDSNDPTGSGGSGTGGSGTATGGSTPSGGSGGASGGATNLETVLYTFNSDLEGFAFSDVAGTDPYVNLVAPGTAVVAGGPPVLGWASKDHDGSAMPAGSLQIKANFSDWDQTIAVEVKGPVDRMQAPLDLTNKKLRARVLLEKGLSSKAEAPGGVVFYVKTGTTYAWGQAPWKNLDKAGTWTTVLFDMAAPDSGSSADFDPSSPVQLGFQFSSGGGGTAGEFGDPLETVLYVDQVTWSN